MTVGDLLGLHSRCAATRHDAAGDLATKAGHAMNREAREGQGKDRLARGHGGRRERHARQGGTHPPRQAFGAQVQPANAGHGTTKRPPGRKQGDTSPPTSPHRSDEGRGCHGGCRSRTFNAAAAGAVSTATCVGTVAALDPAHGTCPEKVSEWHRSRPRGGGGRMEERREDRCEQMGEQGTTGWVRCRGRDGGTVPVRAWPSTSVSGTTMSALKQNTTSVSDPQCRLCKMRSWNAISSPTPTEICRRVRACVRLVWL